MKFYKMNGTGNDFIIINNLDRTYPTDAWPSIARRLCERRMSIGADGFMVVEPTDENADFKMRFYNADGSTGEMCGNGARCICRYGYEFGLTGKTQRVETAAGIVTGERIDKRLYRIQLNNPSIMKQNYPVTLGGMEYPCSYIELGSPGVPHAVIPVTGLQNYPEGTLFDLGKRIRHHEAFPKGANVNFYEIIDKDRIYERTYERGVEGFTHACGTGTASMVAVLTLLGKVSGKAVRVDMTGGELIVDAEAKNGKIHGLYLTGTTNMVASGTVMDEDLPV